MRIETVEQYRERMIQAFHNADCDSLISVVALPTEKEFRNLEWLLKKKYVPFLKKANKALKAKQWIPVSEKLPKYSDSVLVSLFDDEIDLGSYYCDTWHTREDGSVEDGIVLAWMPLPKPYEGDKE